MVIKIDKDPLAVEQNSYLCRVLIIQIVYDLDACPINLTDNFKFKNSSFGATSMAKNSDKEKYVLSCYEITVDSVIHGFLITILLEMSQFLVLIIVHHLTPTITRITF